MNILNKDFTKNEKTLLVILVLVIVGALYYLFVFTPIENGIHSARVEQQALETELVATKARVEKIKAMAEEYDAGGGALTGYMPSYNAGKSEIDFLHKILGNTTDYSVNFTNLTREGDLIRREFVMKFTARNYAQAQEVVKALEESEIRCLVGGIVVSPVERELTVQDQDVDVNLTGTFYETLQGGTPDKELPEDANDN
ncbi:Type II secretion system (T2SS), protein M [Butyrivibrio sp. ob235]|uniref:type II secretion system protein M n=1 Tax=Butyrivibrio sp. ob235 TaxID=1761780 RepID=UPI0008D408EF|nr:type II secretion system protein M [Butyrivibrio sp. ob235]SEK92697.1 Type II secretion system (T2SS), protein M [Butyrivibrio sp. ob235]